MNGIFLLVGAGALAIGMAVSSLLIRESTLEELNILLKTDSTDEIISMRWGEEEFPAFFKNEWGSDSRKTYRLLMKRMKKADYGSSKKLLRALIRIEDDSVADSAGAVGDTAEPATSRMLQQK